MAQTKCLGSGWQKPHYLEMSSLKNHQDLQLVSQNGEMISSNKVVFAGLCHKIVSNALTEEESKLVIVTEHTKDQLNKIVNFATTGKIVGYKDQLDLARDEETVKAFRDFGINLLGLNLSPAALTEDVAEYTKSNEWSVKQQNSLKFEHDRSLDHAVLKNGNEDFYEAKTVNPVEKDIEFSDHDFCDQLAITASVHEPLPVYETGLDGAKCAKHCKIGCCQIFSQEQRESLLHQYKSFNLKQRNQFFSIQCKRMANKISERARKRDQRLLKRAEKAQIKGDLGSVINDQLPFLNKLGSAKHERKPIIYHLPFDGDRKTSTQVCSTFFFSVLHLSRGMVNTISGVLDRCDSGVLQPDRRGSYTSGIREQHKSVTRRIEEFAQKYNSKNKALNPQTGLFLSNELTTCAHMYKDFLAYNPDVKVAITKFRSIVKKEMKMCFPKLAKKNERR